MQEEIASSIVRETLQCLNCGRLFEVERQLGEPRPSDCTNCRLKPSRLDQWLKEAA